MITTYPSPLLNFFTCYVYIYNTYIYVCFLKCVKILNLQTKDKPKRPKEKEKHDKPSSKRDIVGFHEDDQHARPPPPKKIVIDYTELSKMRELSRQAARAEQSLVQQKVVIDYEHSSANKMLESEFSFLVFFLAYNGIGIILLLKNGNRSGELPVILICTNFWINSVMSYSLVMWI